MSKNTGGPAFPCLEATLTGIGSDGEERFDTEAHGGMTLRDYFAATAPISVADANGAFYLTNGRNAGMREMINMLAVLRGTYADAMIAERAA